MQRILVTSALAAIATYTALPQDPASDPIAAEFGVDLPAQPAPGVTFPTVEGEINSWVFGDNPDLDSIYRHGWGLWAGLTKRTGTEAFGVEDARIYQTWSSPAHIIKKMRKQVPSTGLVLRTPRQHTGRVSGPAVTDAIKANENGMIVDTSSAEVVAYSPASARHAFDNELFFTETLTSFAEQGYTSIPRFPNDSVTIKPVYKLISPDKCNDVDGKRLYAMPAWPGIPTTITTDITNNGYPPTAWDHLVYIDVDNPGRTDASGVDPTGKDPSAKNTYGMGDFITIPVTAEDQHYFEKLVHGQFDPTPLASGDTLVLVGMHVATRETERWTWQSFWWSANPDQPNTPSSSAIAAMRPKILGYEARHYAMTTAYSMVSPAQPLRGGQSVGEPVVGFNPHLEAAFNPPVFERLVPIATPEGVITTDLGIQSNCMTCHGLANYGSPGAVYGANFYLSMDDPARMEGLDADFAWSVVNSAVPRNPK